ncbi:MAG: VOC family protein [Actinomycetota bacterium]|nr:VOC family protein [Actinomycetota bacterium]
MAVKPIPDGYHTVTPYLIVGRAAELIDFTKRAFGAEEMFRMPGPGGAIMHAEIRIGDSVVMLSDASTENPSTSTMIHLYVEDVDAVYQRALEAGASSLREPENQFYGDRSAGVKDAFGNQWWLATHVEDVSPEELQRRQDELARQQA